MVDMGKYEISHNPSTLVCLGLGSCVGVAIYDEVKKLAGMAHIMLSFADESRTQSEDFNGNKYANIAIPAMISDLEKKGCTRSNMKAKIAGGAQMFTSFDNENILDIGKKNIESVQKVLADEKIHIVSKDLGGNSGRTLRFNIETFKMLVRTKDKTIEI